jgi:uncharacterized iron-regulated membrane protein
MKAIKILVGILFFLAPFQILSQGNQSVEMADAFREDGKIYVVVLGLVIILTGVTFFLIWVDRRIFRVEKKLGKQK